MQAQRKKNHWRPPVSTTFGIRLRRRYCLHQPQQWEDLDEEMEDLSVRTYHLVSIRELFLHNKSLTSPQIKNPNRNNRHRPLDLIPHIGPQVNISLLPHRLCPNLEHSSQVISYNTSRAFEPLRPAPKPFLHRLYLQLPSAKKENRV